MRPTKQCYWTRKLELELIKFMRQREHVWKPSGNTNYHIQQRYKAYAEFASTVGRGFTARSVRDRWVNIRSTFNHNVHKVLRSKVKAKSPSDIYVPCWPLWKPLQFLQGGLKLKSDSNEFKLEDSEETNGLIIKEEYDSQADSDLMDIKECNQRTNRPRHKINVKLKQIDKEKGVKCKNLLDDLLLAMKPLVNNNSLEHQSYWFFGRHIIERLDSMRPEDSVRAVRDITQLLDEWPV